jgi:hypothetical protein
MDSKDTDNTPAIPEEAFAYLEMPKSGWGFGETFKDKFIRKTKENPLVPIGLVATISALSYGLWQMKTGDRAMSQKMMRMRVYAQSFTVFALIGGILYQAKKRPATAAADK